MPTPITAKKAALMLMSALVFMYSCTAIVPKCGVGETLSGCLCYGDRLDPAPPPGDNVGPGTVIPANTRHVARISHSDTVLRRALRIGCIGAGSFAVGVVSQLHLSIRNRLRLSDQALGAK